MHHNKSKYIFNYFAPFVKLNRASSTGAEGPENAPKLCPGRNEPHTANLYTFWFAIHLCPFDQHGDILITTCIGNYILVNVG